MTTEATRLRDAIAEKMAALPGYLKVRKYPVPQLQPDDLPAINVFIASENLTPDGDANAGEPSFVSSITIAIGAVRGFADTATLDGAMDAAVDVIEAAILTDAEFVASVEGISGISRRRLYPQQGETYFVELRLEMTFVTRVDFPPVLPDDFRLLSMSTRPAGAGPDTSPIHTHIIPPT